MSCECWEMHAVMHNAGAHHAARMMMTKYPNSAIVQLNGIKVLHEVITEENHNVQGVDFSAEVANGIDLIVSAMKVHPWSADIHKLGFEALECLTLDGMFNAGESLRLIGKSVFHDDLPKLRAMLGVMLDDVCPSMVLWSAMELAFELARVELFNAQMKQAKFLGLLGALVDDQRDWPHEEFATPEDVLKKLLD